LVVTDSSSTAEHPHPSLEWGIEPPPLRESAGDELVLSPELVMVSPPEIAARARAELADPRELTRSSWTEPIPAPSGSSVTGTSVIVVLLVVLLAGLVVVPVGRHGLGGPGVRPRPTERRSAIGATRRFVWAPVPGARGYVVRFFRDGILILGARVRNARVDVPRRILLTAGIYRWIVAPITDSPNVVPNVDSTFVVRSVSQ
jgi:hypothetical protein